MTVKQIELVCSGCGVSFSKLKKEYDRQTRNGKKDFYCTRQCFGYYVSSVLVQSEKIAKWRRSDEWKAWQAKHAEQQRRKADPFKIYLKLMKNHKQEIRIDLAYLKALWEKQDGRCAYSGLRMNHPTWTATDAFTTASIDRIDPDKGYVDGNVQFVVRALNWAKNSARDDVFRSFIADMIESLTPRSRCPK